MAMRIPPRALGTLLALCALLLVTVPVHAEGALDFASLRGRVIYLDFWASWCVPCRHSFPWLQSMADSYGPQGLSVVAINLDQNRADAEHFLAQYHPGFEVRFDASGKSAEQYRVSGMPTSVLIDRHGAVRYTHIGFRPADAATYEQQLRELLAEQ
jgi:thiol-disulfide isomerase/thioredoxin